MKKGFAIAAAVSLYVVGSVALADTSVESSTMSSDGGTTSSTTVHQETAAPAPVVVAPVVTPAAAPSSIQRTKFKKERRGLFGKTKVKGETTTVTP